MTGTVKLVSAGGGSVSIVTPSTGSNRTVTLPDADYTIPTASSNATLTTQGDILYRDGSGLQRLPKGAASRVLTMNSGATAPEWAEAAGGGKILQYQEHTLTAPTAVNSNTDTYVDSGLTKTITCSNSSHKVLVVGIITVGADAFGGWSSGLDMHGQVAIHRTGGTSAGLKAAYAHESFQDVNRTTCPLIYIDSPASTDELTYKIQVRRRYAGSGSTNIFLYGGSADKQSLLLFELDD